MRTPTRSNEEEVALIKSVEAMIKDGYKTNAAARKHDVSRSTYWRIKTKHKGAL